MQVARRTLIAASLSALALSAIVLPAQAQDKWPSKPITYVVPFPAGGTTDILARLIGQKLGPALGTNVIIDNRPGAGGNIGSELVARAAPDGYTIMGGTISSHSINASLYKLSYDPLKSFAPITLIGTNANVLVVNPASPFKSVKELIAAAKAKPASLSFASAGNGTSQHLSAELFKTMTGIDMVHIPYKGSAPAIQDVIGGQVPLMFDTTVVAGPFIQSGKVRPLAVTSAKRVASMPDVPTMAEAGVPGYEVVSWQAMFAPAGTPPAIVQRLQTEVAAILKQPDVQERLAKLGVEPSGMAPQQLADFQAAEIAKWAKVVKAANVKVD
ncbi:tripartite tricarboxylate transporter substrate binding protein [Noviherbaspirillum sp. L7-7A]|uniref:Bug family tripartite tricarboxylate transporter substrate binding protein n=1 Tax=Noviherbaspirillum sp. L7-7A TaxID=2850560 RepID=UPI001C2C35C5|nr:tripartite tricarboxylate transporter substrate binding protein [Noviherbaspirillum sp. L7-7A]MBV0882195.1 tripartite tricarboxylate transporter substrate binding protein [Noviherbaspirillum sp. L7-7A]